MTAFNLTFLFAGFLIATALCVFVFKLVAKWDILDRLTEKLLVAILPVPLLIVTGWIFNDILGSSWEMWNGARLAPTIGLVHGYKLYYGIDPGPILGTVYTPLNYLVYLPAAIASSPTVAILIGISIAMAFYFLPVAWLLLGEYLDTYRKKGIALASFVGFWFLIYLIYEISGGGLASIFSAICYFSAPLLWLNSKLLLEKCRAVIFGIWGFALFCLFTYYFESLAGVLRLHADAPALGISALAGAALYFRDEKNNFRALAISATVAIAAFWTKQQALPLIFGLSTYVYLADGRRCFWRYLACLGVAAVSISTVLLLVFDPKQLILNAFTFPSNLPLTGEPKEVLFNAFREIVQQSILFVTIVAFLAPHLNPPVREDRLLSWLIYNRWAMFLIVALFAIPSALLARTRIGGNFNNLSFTVYFIAIAAILAIVKAASMPELQRSVQTVVLCLSVCLLLIHVPLTVNTFNTLPNQKAILATNPQEYFYRYAKANPGKAFFPWVPLANVMGEGKLYHFDYGVTDRILSGGEVSEQAFRAGIPKDMKFLVYPAAIPSHIGNVEETGVMKAVRKYLPDVSKSPVESTEIKLPGWQVYTSP
ncbi:hypothetical protein [Pseudanabaena sp. PCC 6802]|uniref:hypothetical protein n=1 Tax=Pseudanabaena sp. PCC 6802 TaxID=118173 RepID=UPI000348FFBF|nr:hypothetical protein [Pseudanabaena sp. PCC 6802]